MVIKTGLRTILFVLLLLLLCWIPRLVFVYQSDLLMEGQSLLSWKYLKVTTLFDLKTLAIWFSPYLLVSTIQWFVNRSWLLKVKAFIFLILTIAFLVYSFIAVFYYPISKSIAGKELFTILEGQESVILFSYAAEYWWAIVSILLCSYVWYRLVFKIKLDLKRMPKVLYLSLTIVTWALLARGSVSLKPLNHLDAYAALAPNMAVSSMSPVFILLESIHQEPLSEQNYLSDMELSEFNQQFYKDYDCDVHDSLNICLILLESFGLEYTGMNQVGATSYTPFLDSLISANSIYFENAFANGLRSMDAVASIFSGVPNMMDQSFVGSLYAHNEIPSLVDRLTELGYTSSFYHGADRESMGFKPYLISHGLQHYEGLQDYPNQKDYDGKWGIFDEPYLSYVAAEMDKKRSPFFTTIFTLSSHHPYTVPEKYSYLPKGDLEIHQSIGYTDASLRNFFELIKDRPWFNETLFVITADHSSVNDHRRYQTRSGRYRIPLLFYLPSEDLNQKVSTPAQHLDIAPTILDLICYGKPFYSLGKSLLDTPDGSAAIVHYEGGVYSITNSVYSLEMSNGTAIALYHELKDPDHLNNMIQTEPEIVNDLMHELKAYIQNFNHRIITNTYH